MPGSLEQLGPHPDTDVLGLVECAGSGFFVIAAEHNMQAILRSWQVEFSFQATAQVDTFIVVVAKLEVSPDPALLLFLPALLLDPRGKKEIVDGTGGLEYPPGPLLVQVV
jgi:hypothetical protein